MERHKIGPEANGVAGMLDICKYVRKDPRSSPVTYEVVGQDLACAPIDAGVGSFAWEWDTLPQTEYDLLLEFQGDIAAKSVYAHTSHRSGASGIDFGDYLCQMGRPTFAERDGLVCRTVRIEFTGAVPA